MKNSSFKPVSIAMRKPAKKLRAKRGFHDSTLLNRWPELVGQELAQISRPNAIKSSRQGSVLVLSCVSSYASELSMRLDEIILKLNAQLGADAISRIQIKHEHIDFQISPQEKPVQKPSERILPAGLKAAISEAKNEELRQALVELSRDFYRHPKGV